MNNRKKLLLAVLLCLFVSSISFAQTTGKTKIETVFFRFVPEEDMFYIPWEGNKEQLNGLYALIDEYRTEITSGYIPIYVEGYCASLPTSEENFKMAAVRSKRVKSELITHTGLAEGNFITKNHPTAYQTIHGQTYRDMVVVTLPIPAKPQMPPESEPQARQEPGSEPESEPGIEVKPEANPKPQPAPEETSTTAELPAPAQQPARPPKPYCFAIHTNLLYDAFLLPTLGVEWRVIPAVGIKVEGSRSQWSDKHGKAQKIWLVNPQVRWYLLKARRFYVGGSANFGMYNVYKGMIGSLFSDNTGYQGKLWNAGLTVGYQLYLSRSFSLDFNLGLGYTSLEYDSFNIIDQTRVYKDRNKSKNFWGPTQAGINLIWTISGNKNQLKKRYL